MSEVSRESGYVGDLECLWWVLEGKINDSDTSAWVVLRTYVNDASFNRVGATHS